MQFNGVNNKERLFHPWPAVCARCACTTDPSCSGTSVHLSVVWVHLAFRAFTKLQKLQNRAARILLRASYDTNSDSLIDKLGWRKLDKQRLINKATMVYKSLNGLAPNYLRSKFTYHSNVSSYSLRGTNDNLAIPLPHTYHSHYEE